MSKNFYKILEVEKNASLEEIKNSYKRLAKKYHPDKNPQNKEAEERFKEISEAYSVIGDENNRIKYDMETNFSFQNQFKNPNFYDQQNDFDYFKVKDNQFKFRGEVDLDINLAIRISFDEMNLGTTKKIKYTKMAIDKDLKFEKQNKTVEIKIPKGVFNGSAMTYVGYGNEFFNFKKQVGALIVTIYIEDHPLFKLYGNEVFYEYPIKFSDIFKDVIEVPTPKDGTTKIKIPNLLNNQTKIRIKNKGIPIFGKDDEYGDVILYFSVEIPKNLSETQKQKLKEFVDQTDESNYPEYKSFKEKYYRK